jgi:sterol desaturase/sphingolipid hydroxylase (fatty acid hydroxylase superfamily)
MSANIFSINAPCSFGSNGTSTKDVMLMLLLVGIAVLLITLEKLWPAGELPKVKGWWARVACLNLAQLGVVIFAGQTWEVWLKKWSLLHISSVLPPFLAAFVAYLLSCFVFYWWHRFRHESNFFWRLCHQMHHSPRRIEVLTSFYKHPVEITIDSFLTSSLIYPLLGCDVNAAAIYMVLITAAEYFYHWNVHTPHWLGWFIQRPESHRVHHQRNRHSMNYADLPVLDWLFGTLKNPAKRVPNCGFDAIREARFGEILAFRDVHKTAPSPICFGCSRRWRCQAAKEGAK